MPHAFIVLLALELRAEDARAGHRAEHAFISVQYSAHEKLNKAYDSYCNSRFRMPCFYEALLKSVWNSPLLIFKRLLPIAFRYDNNCRKKASYH